MRYIAALFMLLASPAFADDSVSYVKVFGVSMGSSPINIELSMHPDENRNLFMSVVANDPAGIRSVSIISSGKAVVTQAKPSFMFVWPRAAMRSGENIVTIQSTNSAGVQRQLKGYVDKPSL